MSKGDPVIYTIDENVRDWLCATAAYDAGDPRPLSDLIRKGRRMPAPFRVALADIVSGRRLPNRKAAAKALIRPAHRLKLAICVYEGLLSMDMVKRNAHEHASNERVEPIDIVRLAESKARLLISRIARELGVSEHTVRSLIRDLRKRLDRYPIV
jgi:hypothetical protein